MAADAVGMIFESIAQNWTLFGMIIFMVLSVVPWVALIIINTFNRNVWREIKTTMDRRSARIIRILQSGHLEIVYRHINPDKTITIANGKKGGLDEILTPTTAPHPDSGSFKQNYICVEGQEGTVNILEKTKFDINSPQKKMGFTMWFETGREYERYTALGQQGGNMKMLISIAIPAVLLILVLIMIYSQSQYLDSIMAQLTTIAGNINAITASLSKAG